MPPSLRCRAAGGRFRPKEFNRQGVPGALKLAIRHHPGGQEWGRGRNLLQPPSLPSRGDGPGGRVGAPRRCRLGPPVPLRKLRPRGAAQGGRGPWGPERSRRAPAPAGVAVGGSRARGWGRPGSAGGTPGAHGGRASWGAAVVGAASRARRAVGDRGPPVRPRSRLPRRPARAARRPAPPAFRRGKGGAHRPPPTVSPSP